MKRITLIVSFLSLFLIENVSAQSNLGLSIGGGYISSTLDKTKLPYWENGYLISFSSDYKITNNISLFFSLSYQKLFFTNKKLVSLVVPAFVGYRYSISGENSSVFDFSIGGKSYMSDSRIKPYLTIGLGLLLINQGKIEHTHWILGSHDKSASLYSNSDKNFSVAQINFGVGLEMGFIDNFHLVLEGKMINSFGGPSYFPFTASVKFVL